MQQKVNQLSLDFAEVIGKPFDNFFCPILLRDEKVNLCQAHLVNQAFQNASKRWTIQRADVDNFYGWAFEADFVALKEDGAPLDHFVAGRQISQFRPEIRHRGQKIEFYKPNREVPSQHSQIILESSSGAIRLALKIDPEELKETHDDDWQISIEKDCRLAALVSLLKAAHLTLFEMLGYRYAMSAGGMFLGRSILGKFFLENKGLAKKDVLHNARGHFAEFINLVRPVLVASSTIEDTIDDRIVYICEGSCRWAFLLFIRTGGRAHAVIVPQMESTEAAVRFVNFLKEQGSTFQARRCFYNGDSYQASPDTKTFCWPAVTLD